ncbi:hypothetical protein [Zymomonas mobilis]|uniref:Uncharacterized protein n=1 Tax=Zymomonas mobilis subsp. pomaceae (strain ATCC 29192 / DSM 22645 / JCM 10191 / CCUG 17912 / NBRC 13757 / NCIMB 11200 / NRRL B-4491 / Barker I) TaxID=579138 RepID=F8ETI8_ZYMMT|nr:hypothetical protein [Zymomonas mobilis]AEI38013.1 hypothetical protein Zymop_1117 [Zymomonas mobilis subsp. pomaceae ATCC 29192]MDX5949381.1 hypothetical protein [Zymomonas mobilis subsp. pomaceae]GEB89123.1 hypothetical protein ZMO02_07600 [Zymomonas mobilis subsp. pomaceae]
MPELQNQIPQSSKKFGRIAWLLVAWLITLPIDLLAFYDVMTPKVSPLYRRYYIDHSISAQDYQNRSKAPPIHHPIDWSTQ